MAVVGLIVIVFLLLGIAAFAKYLLAGKVEPPK
jgi:hypothetical protein